MDLFNSVFAKPTEKSFHLNGNHDCALPGLLLAKIKDFFKWLFSLQSHLFLLFSPKS